MPTRYIAIVPESGVNPSDLARVSAAVQKQVTRDLAPVWQVSATVDPFPSLEDIPSGYWPIVLTYRTLETDAGIHVDSSGQPYALIEMSPSWSLTASHVAIEMITDPFGSRSIPGVSPRDGRGDVEFRGGVCDPCEHPDSAYLVNDVLVSDFCTPAFWEPSSNDRRSFTGAIRDAYQILPGGHLCWYDPASNTWWLRRLSDGVLADVEVGMIDPEHGTVREFLCRHSLHLQSTKLSLEAFEARVGTTRQRAMRASQSRAYWLRTSLEKARSTRPLELEARVRAQLGAPVHGAGRGSADAAGRANESESVAAVYEAAREISPQGRRPAAPAFGAPAGAAPDEIPPAAAAGLEEAPAAERAPAVERSDRLAAEAARSAARRLEEARLDARASEERVPRPSQPPAGVRTRTLPPPLPPPPSPARPSPAPSDRPPRLSDRPEPSREDLSASFRPTSFSPARPSQRLPSPSDRPDLREDSATNLLRRAFSLARPPSPLSQRPPSPSERPEPREDSAEGLRPAPFSSAPPVPPRSRGLAVGAFVLVGALAGVLIAVFLLRRSEVLSAGGGFRSWPARSLESAVAAPATAQVRSPSPASAAPQAPAVPAAEPPASASQDREARGSIAAPPGGSGWLAKAKIGRARTYATPAASVATGGSTAERGPASAQAARTAPAATGGPGGPAAAFAGALPAASSTAAETPSVADEFGGRN